MRVRSSGTGCPSTACVFGNRSADSSRGSTVALGGTSSRLAIENALRITGGRSRGRIDRGGRPNVSSNDGRTRLGRIVVGVDGCEGVPGAEDVAAFRTGLDEVNGGTAGFSRAGSAGTSTSISSGPDDGTSGDGRATRREPNQRAHDASLDGSVEMTGLMAGADAEADDVADDESAAVAAPCCNPPPPRCDPPPSSSDVRAESLGCDVGAADGAPP